MLLIESGKGHLAQKILWAVSQEKRCPAVSRLAKKKRLAPLSGTTCLFFKNIDISSSHRIIKSLTIY